MTKSEMQTGAGYIVSFCCKLGALLHLQGRIKEAEGAGNKLVLTVWQLFLQHEVRTLWGAVYTCLLITHTTVSLRSGSGDKTIRQLPSTRQLKQANKQSQRSRDEQMRSNCVYFYLLPTRAAAGRCPCLRSRRMIASSNYCKQLNHHKQGLALLSEG